MKLFLRTKVLAAALSVFAAGALFTACEEEMPPFLTLDQESVIASPEDSRFVIDVKSNVTWTVSCKADWVKVFGEQGDYKGSFEILIAANKTAGTRTAEVIVSGSGCTSFVNIIQTSGELSLVVPVKEYSAGKDASELAEDDIAFPIEAKYLAQMCVNLIMTYSPEKIILGGGVMERESLLKTIRSETVRLLGGYIQHDMIQKDMENYIVRPQLYPVSGLVGSWYLGMKALKKQNPAGS